MIRRLLACGCVLILFLRATAPAADRPNILLAISDDQSAPYASAYGCTGISTPAFDRVAREGVLFTRAYAASPGCSPCRAALLTGRHCLQIEHAGTHASSFPLKYRTYPERLSDAGYHTGYTGKGWGPGNFKIDGREHNPAGPNYSRRKLTPPYSGTSRVDYAANFEDFLNEREKGQPFCFWFGASEPHRPFEQGIGLKSGKKLEDAFVPDFLPDTPEIRSDILDYCTEIEWFDAHLGRMLELLEQRGELDNTLVIVTSDNGMAFPRAKANCYEFGIHMPLAIRWGERIPGGRTSDDLVGFVDLTATILDAAGIEPESAEFRPPHGQLAGQSLLPILSQEGSGVLDPRRRAVFSSRERHSSSRYLNLSYPVRAMRTGDYLVIRNLRPERWPAGAPQKLTAPPPAGKPGPDHGGYHDIDGCPSLSFLVENHDDPRIARFLSLAVDLRPEIEIFDVRNDPACLNNLAADPEFGDERDRLVAKLNAELKRTGDPRVVHADGGDVFETYPRYSPIRHFPEPQWAREQREKFESDGWVRLFDGSTLDGWRVAGPEDSFDVVNGAIRAKAPSGPAHLYFVGSDGHADWDDFELVFEALTTPGSDGGVYIHTSYQPTGFPDAGFEIQVNNSHSNAARTGSLFGIVDLDQSRPDNQFVSIRVRVEGNRVRIFVEDEVVVDHTGPDGVAQSVDTGRSIGRGTFALQAHDHQSTVFYRNIRVRPGPRPADAAR